MRLKNPPGVSGHTGGNDRESRIELALLRQALENMRGNRMVAPVLALAICAIFSQWVPAPWLVAWYGQMLLGLGAQNFMLARFPKAPPGGDARLRWTRLATAASLFSVISWASMGWYLWVPGNSLHHILIFLLLAAVIAGHATATGMCGAIARPALAVYLLVLVGTPLQGHSAPAIYMAFVAPLYVAFIGLIAKAARARARATIIAEEDRAALLAEAMTARQESERSCAAAQQASIAKSQFLANMSHELRTPLNAILGFSELLASPVFTNNPERVHEYAGLIHTSGRHLLTLINDILDLAKIEAGRWELEESELSLHDVAEDALQLMTWRAQDNTATLENRIGAHLPGVYADPRALKQILLNLLSNAIKFTPPGGTVTMFAEHLPDGALAFGVEDTGIGIAPDDVEGVFDSFGQGKHDITLADRGTGLGLAIVKGLAEAHGGTARLDSRLGHGTRVQVILPGTRVRHVRPAVA